MSSLCDLWDGCICIWRGFRGSQKARYLYIRETSFVSTIEPHRAMVSTKRHSFRKSWTIEESHSTSLIIFLYPDFKTYDLKFTDFHLCCFVFACIRGCWKKILRRDNLKTELRKDQNCLVRKGNNRKRDVWRTSFISTGTFERSCKKHVFTVCEKATWKKTCYGTKVTLLDSSTEVVLLSL